MSDQLKDLCLELVELTNLPSTKSRDIVSLLDRIAGVISTSTPPVLAIRSFSQLRNSLAKHSLWLQTQQDPLVVSSGVAAILGVLVAYKEELPLAHSAAPGLIPAVFWLRANKQNLSVELGDTLMRVCGLRISFVIGVQTLGSSGVDHNVRAEALLWVCRCVEASNGLAMFVELFQEAPQEVRFNAIKEIIKSAKLEFIVSQFTEDLVTHPITHEIVCEMLEAATPKFIIDNVIPVSSIDIWSNSEVHSRMTGEVLDAVTLKFGSIAPREHVSTIDEDALRLEKIANGELGIAELVIDLENMNGVCFGMALSKTVELAGKNVESLNFLVDTANDRSHSVELRVHVLEAISRVDMPSRGQMVCEALAGLALDSNPAELVHSAILCLSRWVSFADNADVLQTQVSAIMLLSFKSDLLCKSGLLLGIKFIQAGWQLDRDLLLEPLTKIMEGHSGTSTIESATLLLSLLDSLQ